MSPWRLDSAVPHQASLFTVHVIIFQFTRVSQVNSHGFHNKRPNIFRVGDFWRLLLHYVGIGLHVSLVFDMTERRPITSMPHVRSWDRFVKFTQAFGPAVQYFLQGGGR